MCVFRSFVGCALAWMLLLSPAIDARADEPAVSFSREVKPILSQNCFACHGPDENKRAAELRLDQRESAVSSAIWAGKPEASELIARIVTTDPDERMPPARSKKPALTAEQIDILKRWIAQGANYDAHWAYAPVAGNGDNPPELAAAIDHQVQATLTAHGLQSGGPADDRILVRRLYFDLTGLPPTAAETAAFVNDAGADRYERLLDRLLQSEHYGERMAMFWLDLVRYADTNGIHGDNHRDHALYRDYVIQAFNGNKPFDQFTIEQLAGDLLPEATPEQQIASGYNRLNMTTREGGAQAKEYFAKYAADRVRNASTVWLGSTLGCAECHDHKFDPFLTRDFYSFAAFFADVRETAVGTQAPVKMPTAMQDEEQQQRQKQIAALKATLAADTPALRQAQTAWEVTAPKELPTQPKVWQTVQPSKMESTGGVKFTVQEDGSILTSGANPATDIYTLTLPNPATPTAGFRLEALTDSDFPAGGLSRGNGNFVLTEATASTASDKKEQPQKIRSVVADYEQQGFPAAHAIDGNGKTGWAVDGHQKPANRTAVFLFDQPQFGEQLTIQLAFQSQYAKHAIGRFRLSLTSVETPSITLAGDGPSAAIVALLNKPADQRSPAEQTQLADYYRSIAPALAATRKQLATEERALQKLTESFQPILITQAGAPREMRVLPRGNWLDDSGPVVLPAAPSFLPPLPTAERASRLDLAHWLVDGKNPLVARVFVNRLWKIMFGEGLVRTLDDFGSQGAPPTHPELLDLLADDFVRSGWDVKHLLRQIALSKTYRLTSQDTPALRELDPANRWLARQNRYRLDAEMVRDNALAISGLLVDQIGGPSVKPYQPPGYWSHLNFPKREWQNDQGDNLYRRGLYTYWCRTFLHPSLLAFDAPSREESCVLRNRSNTPQQALVLLNDPTYVEAARVFAERIVSEGGSSPDQRVAYAWRQTLGRNPSPQEQALLVELVEKHRQQYTEDAAAAKALLHVGSRPAPEKVDTPELAAWTSLARVLLNLHETITRY
ncbi:PSD1 and planctomycete cytochrome C domain-containing protein [Lignipirellula cremea]|uniref:Planctomycete cytochrome C n=1 Tax=Lignipirellula cremea TaxID=2528010 RepID=A0A518E0K4_9BACT|nr:PSD1 and planctomycete cytochrome C domain-containing protein [Lignipirellula cremea]QDU97615.1 Planctomycete cytochrome C [Lignipirellula cremea]